MSVYPDYEMLACVSEGHVNGNNITREQIETLKQEAGQAGDRKQVELCNTALSGDFSARCRCADAIMEARAQRRSPQ